MSIDAKFAKADRSALREVTGEEGLPFIAVEFDLAPCVVFARVELHPTFRQAGDPWAACTLRVRSVGTRCAEPSHGRFEVRAVCRGERATPGGPPPAAQDEDLTLAMTVVNLMVAHPGADSVVVVAVGGAALVAAADVVILSVDSVDELTPSHLPHP